MHRQSRNLTLKRAAEILGVHQQTLRSWERRGLIRLARLPKSGYRRVPVEEIERLQASMMGRSSDPAPEIHLVPPRNDAESQRQAVDLANSVRTELAILETEGSLDAYMQGRRGRAWSP